jgi:hypothetical protein
MGEGCWEWEPVVGGEQKREGVGVNVTRVFHTHRIRNPVKIV